MKKYLLLFVCTFLFFSNKGVAIAEITTNKISGRPTVFYYVTRTTDVLYDGVCDADCSLPEALNAANSIVGSTVKINVPTGTYDLTMNSININNTSSQIIVKGAGMNKTIITSSNGLLVGADIFRIEDGTNAVLKKMTIKNGPDENIIIHENATVLINHCRITDSNIGVNNRDAGNVTIKNSIIKDNHDGFWNTGISRISDSQIKNNTGIGVFHLPNAAYTQDPTLMVKDSKINNNGENGVFASADVNIYNTNIISNEYNGIFISNNILNITDSKINKNNSAGIYYTTGEITIDNSEINNNNNDGNDPLNLTTNYGGGGIMGSSGTLTVTNSDIMNNTTMTNGGGINLQYVADATITDSRITGNDAHISGGAIYADSTGEITISRSLLYKNGAANGAAIYNNSYRLQLINSTIYKNFINSPNNCQSMSAIIYNDQGELDISFCTIHHNILLNALTVGLFSSNNSTYLKGNIITDSKIDNQSATTNCAGSLTSAGYNLYDDYSCTASASDLVVKNARLLSLADNGGSTRTLALSSISKAIDAVPQNDCESVIINDSLTDDQRGFSRPINGMCDIGAYEVQ